VCEQWERDMRMQSYRGYGIGRRSRWWWRQEWTNILGGGVICARLRRFSATENRLDHSGVPTHSNSRHKRPRAMEFREIGLFGLFLFCAIVSRERKNGFWLSALKKVNV
jgi:hypothetical protein